VCHWVQVCLAKSLSSPLHAVSYTGRSLYYAFSGRPSLIRAPTSRAELRRCDVDVDPIAASSTGETIRCGRKGGVTAKCSWGNWRLCLENGTLVRVPLLVYAAIVHIA